MVKSMILRDGVESLPLDCTVELGDGEFFGHIQIVHYCQVVQYLKVSSSSKL
jgi:hypothetical protein